MWKPKASKDVATIWKKQHEQAQQSVSQEQALIATEGMAPVLLTEEWSQILVFLLLLCIRLMLEVVSLKRQLSSKENELNWMQEKLNRLIHEKFVGKRIILAEGQLIMPEILEMDAAVKTDPEETVETEEVVIHRKKKHRGQSLPNLLDGILEEKVEEFLPDCTCPNCQNQMNFIGFGKERKLIEVVPAKLVLVRQKAGTYACPFCEENYPDDPHVVAGVLPQPFISGSFATESLVANIAMEKFYMGSPLYRQENWFGLYGYPLSRQTMDNFLFRATDMLKPLYEHIQWVFNHELNVAHSDESPLKCLHVAERDNKEKKCYMWLFRSGRFEKRQIVLYKFHTGRDRAFFLKAVADFSGFMTTDGYCVYRGIEQDAITFTGCWFHAQYKFEEAAKYGRDKDDLNSPARKALAYFKKFFEIEEQIKNVEPDERLKIRLQKEKPIVEGLKVWLDEHSKTAASQSHLGKAIQYTLNEWDYLNGIFLDGSIDATNNIAERGIKTFVMARKNYLFVNVEKGGEVVGVFHTLIGTALACNVKPEPYLTWVMKRIREIDTKNPKEVELLMPWNAPDEMRIPAVKKGNTDTSSADPS